MPTRLGGGGVRASGVGRTLRQRQRIQGEMNRNDSVGRQARAREAAYQRALGRRRR